MKRILVTGANKGIGLAVVEAILREQADCTVVLGSRNTERGQAAINSLLQANPDWSERLSLAELDVGDDQSVIQAARNMVAQFGEQPLAGLVNNAGIAAGPLADILQANCYGMRRVCEAMAPLLVDGARVVNVTSAAGPNYVAECPSEWQSFFTNAQTPWPALDQLMQEATGDEQSFVAKGLSLSNHYGLSKACANLYSLQFADANPRLQVNACTPGFIETDLTREMIQASGRSIEDMGLKQPADGARVIMHLLFGEVEGSGRYYGSDSLRSPLHCYRAPGSPEYIAT